MYPCKRWCASIVLVLCWFTGLAFAAEPNETEVGLGAWRLEGQPERVMLVTDHHWTQAIFDQEQRTFHRTNGGTHRVRGEWSEVTVQFDSGDPSQVGQTFEVQVTWEGDVLRLTLDDGTVETWRRIDDGNGPLAGAWRITSRQEDGGMQEMPLRARRTLKILSGSRFQWIAFNVETGEFFGTGGGTYTLKDGKYTEYLEFFSRDGSRVGATLEFAAEVTGDEWRHRGQSSRGQPIDEVWSRFDRPEK